MTKNIIAIAVLLALGAVAFFVLRAKPATEREAVKRVIAPVAAEAIDRIEILRHETSQDPLDDELISIERRGTAWHMTKPVEYAVNANAAKSMVDALAALSPIDVISDNKAKHAVLEVDDALGIGVKAFGGGKLLADLIVGVSSGEMTMVRLPGQDDVYRVQGSFRAVFNKRAKNLRDHAVTPLDPGSVTRAKFFNGADVLEIAKEGQGADAKFAPVGAEIPNFDWRKAAGNANALTGLMTRDFQDAPVSDDISGLGEGATRVEFEAAKGGVRGSYTLWIGKDLQKERETFVKTSISDQVFLVSTHIAMRFRTKPGDYARTDEQVAEQEKARKAAEEHGKMHQEHAAEVEAAQAQGQSIPPEIMQQLQQKMKEQGAPKSP
jgi:hypothetical protein